VRAGMVNCAFIMDEAVTAY